MQLMPGTTHALIGTFVECAKPNGIDNDIAAPCRRGRGCLACRWQALIAMIIVKRVSQNPQALMGTPPRPR